MNGYLMVAANEVHFGKYDPTSKAGREILNVWDWVSVRSRCIVKPVVIASRPSPAAGLQCDLEG